MEAVHTVLTQYGCVNHPGRDSDPGTSVEDRSDMRAGLPLALYPEKRVEAESSKLLIMALSFW